MIRVLVIAGVRLFREGIAGFLESQPGIAVVGAAEAGEAFDLAGFVDPDVILVDIPDGVELGAVRRLAAAAPQAKVIAVGITEVEDEIIACIEAGVAGYVSRDGCLQDLVAAIEAAARAELACSPSVAAMLLRCVARNGDRRNGASVNRVGCLTRRESEIASLIAEGLSNKQIAAALHVSLSTVKNHVHSAMQKLETSTRGDIADLFEEAGCPPLRRSRRVS